MNVWNDARKYVETAAEENREMSAEENGAWTRLMEELDTIDEKIGGVLTAEKRQKDSDDAFNAITSRAPERRGGDGAASGGQAAFADSRGTDADAEIRAFLRGERRSVELRHNGPFGSQELRVLQSNTGSPTSVVPTDFYDRLIAHLIEV